MHKSLGCTNKQIIRMFVDERRNSITGTILPHHPNEQGSAGANVNILFVCTTCACARFQKIAKTFINMSPMLPL
jgi:hypothetical protein